LKSFRDDMTIIRALQTVIHLEDVKWLKRRRVLESTSGNTWRGHRVGAGKASKSSCLARQLLAYDEYGGSRNLVTPGCDGSRRSLITVSGPESGRII
jgi:hypothetical protein